MGKNIVLCSDGTGNQDVKNRGTNVFKLYESVDIQGHKSSNATKQVAFYDDGVGTANAFARVVGGAFGWGFSRNVRKMYRELVNVYEWGDRIYLFGFSRGAYTVRALAGFIQHCGILDIGYYTGRDRDELTRTIEACWNEFSRTAFSRAGAAERRRRIPTEAEAAEGRKASVECRRKYHAVKPEEKIDIAFIGVWDTVGAIGTPFDGLREFIGRYIRPIWFADNTLGQEVSRACHALALDEERRTFHPELWNERNGSDPRIKQVWFAGAHSNVGGGYPKQGMSLVTLDWMMNEAKNEGLRFIDTDLSFVHAHQDVHDKLYDSRSGFAVYYRWSPRDLSALCDEHMIAAPKIHISILERIANGTAGDNGTDSYSPGNIPFNLEVDLSGSTTTWPDTSVRDKIPLLMKPGQEDELTGDPPSLLASKGGTVLSGKASYYAFLAVTIITLLVLVAAAFAYLWGCGCSSLPWVVGAIAFFVICSIVIKVWADYVDCALCTTYTKYWHPRRRQLRQLL